MGIRYPAEATPFCRASVLATLPIDSIQPRSRESGLFRREQYDNAPERLRRYCQLRSWFDQRCRLCLRRREHDEEIHFWREHGVQVPRTFDFTLDTSAPLFKGHFLENGVLE
jgi:hypothetical protein